MIPDINLLPQRDLNSARGNWVFILFGALFIGALIFMLAQYLYVTKSIQGLESEQTALNNEKQVLEEKLMQLQEPKGVDLETSVEFIEAISFPVSPLIIELNRYLDEHAYLREYSFEENTVSFTVDFETMTDISTYMNDLLRSPFVKDVIINEMSAFNPTKTEDKPFEVIDRFTNTFEVLINLDYLREADGENR